jgi:hypothetical protein
MIARHLRSFKFRKVDLTPIEAQLATWFRTPGLCAGQGGWHRTSPLFHPGRGYLLVGIGLSFMILSGVRKLNLLTPDIFGRLHFSLLATSWYSNYHTICDKVFIYSYINIWPYRLKANTSLGIIFFSNYYGSSYFISQLNLPSAMNGRAWRAPGSQAGNFALYSAILS